MSLERDRDRERKYGEPGLTPPDPRLLQLASLQTNSSSGGGAGGRGAGRGGGPARSRDARPGSSRVEDTTSRMTRFVAAGSSGLPCPPLWPGLSTSCSWPGSCWSPAPSTRFQQSECLGRAGRGPLGPRVRGTLHPALSPSRRRLLPCTFPRELSRAGVDDGVERLGGCGHLKPALIRGHFRPSSLSQRVGSLPPRRALHAAGRDWAPPCRGWGPAEEVAGLPQ